MPALKFDIPEKIYDEFVSELISLSNFLQQTLCSSDAENKTIREELKSSLADFHKEGGGAPVVTGFKILECAYDKNSKTGQVSLQYDVEFTYGCADIFRTDSRNEKCKFVLDREQQTLILFVTDPVSRDTLDEF